jgi:hypothetical protein
MPSSRVRLIRSLNWVTVSSFGAGVAAGVAGEDAALAEDARAVVGAVLGEAAARGGVDAPAALDAPVVGAVVGDGADGLAPPGFATGVGSNNPPANRSPRAREGSNGGRFTGSYSRDPA